MVNLSIFSEISSESMPFLGNIDQGRETLGSEIPVLVYRLFEYTMKAAVEQKFGKEVAIELFQDAGRIAGKQFVKKLMNKNQNEKEFLLQLQEMMAMFKIGVLRVEQIDHELGIILTVSEDLDCSGLPVLGETVCHYDEGFLSGVFEEYTGKKYTAIEVDCWAKGDRVCRFQVKEC